MTMMESPSKILISGFQINEVMTMMASTKLISAVVKHGHGGEKKIEGWLKVRKRSVIVMIRVTK